MYTVEEKLIKTYGSEAVPTESDLRDLYKRAKELMDQPQVPYETVPRPVFAVSDWLRYTESTPSTLAPTVNFFGMGGWGHVEEIRTIERTQENRLAVD